MAGGNCVCWYIGHHRIVVDSIYQFSNQTCTESSTTVNGLLCASSIQNIWKVLWWSILKYYAISLDVCYCNASKQYAHSRAHCNNSSPLPHKVNSTLVFPQHLNCPAWFIRTAVSLCSKQDVCELFSGILASLQLILLFEKRSHQTPKLRRFV